MKCNNILEAVGETPLIRLNRVAKDSLAEVYVKADYLNPGGSVKDRIGISMIDDAERRGLLKPGGTIIEGTSGNTGMGLALVAVVMQVGRVASDPAKSPFTKPEYVGAGIVGTEPP